MKITKTKIKDLLIVENPIFSDNRGYFMESYSQKKLAEAGINNIFVQDNVSFSKYGVIRGLHTQENPFQAKLVTCLYGKVRDVALDMREDSETYMQYDYIDIEAGSGKFFYIPHGFYHGFSVLSKDVAIFGYKVDGLYNKAGEKSINPLDSKINIDWGIDVNDMIISDKDMMAPFL
jgi:dTDP-4-dehydrorhamnose 3,5-epimerase